MCFQYITFYLTPKTCIPFLYSIFKTYFINPLKAEDTIPRTMLQMMYKINHSLKDQCFDVDIHVGLGPKVWHFIPTLTTPETILP